MQSPILGKALADQNQSEIEAALAHGGQASHHRPALAGSGPEEITFRMAGPADLDALRRLVDLDGAGGGARHLLLDLTRPDAPSRVLVAASDDSILAAIHLGSRHSVADPFRSSAAALELLAARADQIRDTEHRGRPGRFGTLVARLRPARAAVTPRS